MQAPGTEYVLYSTLELAMPCSLLLRTLEQNLNKLEHDWSMVYWSFIPKEATATEFLKYKKKFDLKSRQKPPGCTVVNVILCAWRAHPDLCNCEARNLHHLYNRLITFC